jgi:HSP20 family molecular chaperone IbpA
MSLLQYNPYRSSLRNKDFNRLLNSVTANCKDGVLEVIIQKQEKVLPKKITINA